MIFNPAHPGEVLRDYLGEMSVKEAASRLGVTRAHLSRILNGHAGVTAAMSLRLSAALGTSPEFWLRMQIQHDLWRAQRAKQPKVPVPSYNEKQGTGSRVTDHPRFAALR